MSNAADFVVQSPDKKVQLVVEAKGRTNATEEWAKAMRRNLIKHELLSPAPYFILALPDHFYIWRDARSATTVPPDFRAETAEVLKSYLKSSQTALKDLSEESFEIIVKSWLEDLVSGELAATATVGHQWLADLSPRVRDGDVKTFL